jgi:hypothetical protein
MVERPGNLGDISRALVGLSETVIVTVSGVTKWPQSFFTSAASEDSIPDFPAAASTRLGFG